VPDRSSVAISLSEGRREMRRPRENGSWRSSQQLHKC
jgi:hypothetical protein